MRTLCLFAVVAILAVPALAAPQEAGFTQAGWVGGMSEITGLAWATDGSNTCFVTQKGGALRVIKSGALQAANVTTFTVTTSSECGLIGICVDPNYSSNKNVYVFVTENSTTQKIYRVTTMTNASGDIVQSSRIQVGPNLPTRNENHDGGGLAISPDGHLYWSVGDLDATGDTPGPQGLDGSTTEWTTLAAKIGRCDRNTGAAIATNPFYEAGNPTSVKSYTFAKSFRNPFGIRFRPGTSQLWLTEVGDAYEQIFLVPAGATQGSVSNGATPPKFGPRENNTNAANGMIPRLAYQTNVSTFGGCITRGCFYNGSMFPGGYSGNFFFCDYNSGKVMKCQLSGDTISSTTVFADGISGPTDVAVGPDGALYVASIGGSITRLSYAGSQSIVTSTSSMTINEASSGTFQVKLASMPGGNVTVNLSVVAGGSPDVTVTPSSLTFTTGNWNVNQTVTVSAASDADAVNDSATVRCSSSGLSNKDIAVTVNDNDKSLDAPTAAIAAPVSGDVVSGTNAEFYGNGTDPQGKDTLLKAEFYIDDVLYYTDMTAGGHYHINGDHLSWNTTSLKNGNHTLKMTVYDSTGLSGSHQITVTVKNSGSDGLLARYYDDMTLSHLVMTRVDPGVNFNWGNGSPDPSVPADNFSVRWSGVITPDFTETTTFYARTDDGVRLWVNGTQIINNWVNKGADPESTGTIPLTAGKSVPLVMEYFENGGGAVAQLSWSSASQPRTAISPNNMGTVSAHGGGGGGGAGGAGGGGGCGLTGLEGVIGLGLAAAFRRRRR